MFCRNCGKEVFEQAVMCVACGVPPKAGKKYCNNCGAETNPIAEMCVKCGVKLASPSTEGKEWMPTLLICLFLGVFGIHRFYTGHVAIGLLQLLTLGGCGIWTLIDFALILTGSYKDSKGNLLVKK
jgi:ribosomal protein L37E